MVSIGFDEFQKRVAERKRQLKAILEEKVTGKTEIVFEAGCGHGHWLADYAMAHPDKFCLGIDIINERVERANRKKDKAGLGNLQFVRGEAYETLELLAPDVKFDSIFLLFLDPWPKKRHWKNRLFSQRFLEEAAKRSSEGTRLYFRTDHPGYFEWAEEVAAGQTVWYLDTITAWPFERETVFQAKADSYQSMILVKQ